MPKRSLATGQPPLAPNASNRRHATRHLTVAVVLASLLSGCLPIHRVSLELPQPSGDMRRLIASRCRLPITHENSVGFQVGGETAHRAMLAVINEAQHSIYLEMFIFQYDVTGKEVAEALVRRAKEGVDVRVRLDSLGIEYGRNDYKLIDVLRRGGVRVQIHNPYYLSWTGFNVTHRKIVVADEGHALTGGVNVGDEFRYTYYDLMLDVRGEAARQIAWIFKRSWGEDLAEATPPTPRNVYASEEAGTSIGDEPLQVAVMEPDSDQAREVRASYLLGVRNARQSLDLAFPYMWDEEMLQAIIEAARRGVRVRLLIPDWGNHGPWNLLNQASAKRLAAVGAEIGLFAPKFLHLKYLAADGVWASVGSTNGDTRSLLENYELNVSFFNEKTIHSMERYLFQPMWDSAHKVATVQEFDAPASHAWLVRPLEFFKAWF